MFEIILLTISSFVVGGIVSKAMIRKQLKTKIDSQSTIKIGGGFYYIIPESKLSAGDYYKFIGENK